VLIPTLFLLAVATVPLAGGRLERLADLRFVSSWALLSGLGIQVVILQVLHGTGLPGLEVAHVASYVLVIAFVWRNRAIWELSLIGVGGLANFAAIATNGGVMPAHPAAWERAGMGTGEAFANSALTTDAPLWFLGDVLAVPAGWPLANVFSIGDVVLLVGVVLLLHRRSGSRLVPGAPRAPGAPGAPDARCSGGPDSRTNADLDLLRGRGQRR
jgi:lipoprotein signal peptidase